MAKGKAKSTLLGIQGIIGHQDAPSWEFLYEHSTVRNPNYNIGDRVVLPDGRVFRYSKATNIFSSCKYGVKFYGQIGDGVATQVSASAAIGDASIKIAASGVTVDEYRGGYFMAHVTIQQFRGIIGNTATDGAGNIVVYLDAALTNALVDSSSYCELLQSPYRNTRLTAGPGGGLSGNDYSSVAGIPNVVTTVVDELLWLQTWGPIWVNPHGSSLQDAGITGGERALVFDCEGSITLVDDVVHGPCGAGGDLQQHAGFIIDRSAASTSGPPLVMLQISP